MRKKVSGTPGTCFDKAGALHMRILLVNPPFHSATTTYGVGAQVPLGLVLVGRRSS